jgi:hypothetical protein
MLATADRGEIDLGYCDEAGFALAHPNRSAWTPVGQCHTSDALRGKRLNVVGALLSSGELFAVKLWETMTALLFAGFLGLLVQHVGQPLVLILDNAYGKRDTAAAQGAGTAGFEVALPAALQPGT